MGCGFLAKGEDYDSDRKAINGGACSLRSGRAERNSTSTLLNSLLHPPSSHSDQRGEQSAPPEGLRLGQPFPQALEYRYRSSRYCCAAEAAEGSVHPPPPDNADGPRYVSRSGWRASERRSPPGARTV